MQKFRPIHPKEIEQDWQKVGLSREAVKHLQQLNLDYLAQALGLTTNGKARLQMLFTGSHAILKDGKPFVKYGKTGFEFKILPQDWEQIRKLLKAE